MSYTLSRAEFTRLKSALTRAENSGDAAKLLAACEEALTIFEAKGFPDNWSKWRNAHENALRRLAERVYPTQLPLKLTARLQDWS